ncbi:MAG TPA: hypothetical protein VMH50_16805 [Thermoleophilia bacterium]|nr:hypothetical protein [Thermoleophilia bacterium]
MDIQETGGADGRIRRKKPEGGIAETNAAPEATVKAGSRRRTARPRLHRSDFKKLENYVLGSSAAIITNVSLIVGLGSGQTGKGPILGGLLTVALADNVSDSLGIHLYRESEGYGPRLSSLSTVLNFFSRLLVSLGFIAIVLVFPTHEAMIIAIVWSLALLTVISYLITKRNGKVSIAGIASHVLIAVVVIALSRGIGYLIAHYSP